MTLGIFARTFSRPALNDVLDAIVSTGLRYVQFNLLCAGLPTLPPTPLSDSIARQIRSAFQSRNLVIAAISGTFNMIHPDIGQRAEGLRRLQLLVASCEALGAPIITLCTGTRDPHDMWRAHPENSSAEAWNDLLRSMEAALEIAEQNRITLGIEPELSNVIDGAEKARRLLEHFHSQYLKVVIDPANLFRTGELPRMRQVLDEAFALLADDIVLAHAKDLSADGEAGHEAAGTGLLDYDYYLLRLQRAGVTGPLLLHSLREDQVESSIRFLRGKLEKLSAAELPVEGKPSPVGQSPYPLPKSRGSG